VVIDGTLEGVTGELQDLGTLTVFMELCLKPKARTLVSRVLLGMLAVSALASLGAGGALILERRGLVTLRRVPSPIIKTWVDERGSGIAIVNTDTTPGCFWIGFAIRINISTPRRDPYRQSGFTEVRGEHPDGDEERVWVPSRSIVLRTHPRFAERSCEAWLYDVQGSVGVFGRESPERGIRRGSRETLRWLPYVTWQTGDVPDGFYFYRPAQSMRVVEGPGIVAQHGGLTPSFKWDGTSPVAIDVDMATSEMEDVFILATSKKSGVLGSSWMWTYDPDMTVIDERGDWSFFHTSQRISDRISREGARR